MNKIFLNHYGSVIILLFLFPLALFISVNVVYAAASAVDVFTSSGFFVYSFVFVIFSSIFCAQYYLWYICMSVIVINKNGIFCFEKCHIIKIPYYRIDRIAENDCVGTDMYGNNLSGWRIYDFDGKSIGIVKSKRRQNLIEHIKERANIQ